MDKNTKMLLGVGAVAVVGYLVYQQMNKPKGFMNLTAPNTLDSVVGTKKLISCFGGCCFRGVKYFNDLAIGEQGAQLNGQPCVKTGVNEITTMGK
jgi:hypothetical protein